MTHRMAPKINNILK